MPGIPGQPSPRPSDVQNAVPQVSSFADFQASQAPQNGAPSGMPTSAPTSFSDFQAQQGGGASQPSSGAGYNGPGAGALQMTANIAPTALGIAGGIVGSGAGPAGAIGGAAAGGAAGQQYKIWIEQNVLGKPPQDPQQQLYDEAHSALREGLGQAVGLGVGKAVSSVAATKAGGAAVDAVANLAAKPLAMMKGYVDAAYDSTTEPILRMLQSKSTPLNTEEAGDAIKQLFGADIKQRFGTFVDSYGKLDAVAKVTPLPDEARLALSNNLREFAATKGGDNYSFVRKLSEDVLKSDNGAAFDDLVGQLKSKAGQAFSDNMKNQGTFYSDLAKKLSTFQEGQINGLAERVAGGNASPAEIKAFQQMEIAQGRPADQAVDNYVSTAKDYLAQKKTVSSAYGKFRGFLEGVGEQTKVNADGRGPMQFLNDIQDVPSEKLVERMFDPKNAAALRSMQSETPQVFDQVVKSKMSSLMQKASPDGSLDLMELRKAVNALPGSTRDMLMSSEERGTMDAILNSPKLAALDSLDKMGERGMLSWAQKMAEIGRIGAKSAGSAAAKTLSNSPTLQQAVGGIPATLAASAAMPPQGQQ